MRVFGIDCGTEWTGFGVVEADDARELRALAHGAIQLLKRDHLPVRLMAIHARLGELLLQHSPDVVAIEEVFHAANSKTALKLGQVRGVALLAAASAGVSTAEYAPLAIKSAVCGYGLADKQQVQFMVTRLLRLPAPPERSDAADALAIAICHIHHMQTAMAQARGSGTVSASRNSPRPRRN